MMIFYVAEKLIPTLHFRIPFLMKYVVSKKLQNVSQLEKALEVLKEIGESDISEKDFEKHIGVNKILYI